jgi:hypothetical protein
MNIVFPTQFSSSQEDRTAAMAFAKKMQHLLDSKYGTYRGETAEICLSRILKESYPVIENKESLTHEYSWDLKVNDRNVDIKTTTNPKSVYFSEYCYRNADKNTLYVCYLCNEKATDFKLIGVIDGNQLTRYFRVSKHFPNSGYIFTDTIKNNSLQRKANV